MKFDNSIDMIREKVSDALIQASTVFRLDQKKVYRDAILQETEPRAKWVMEKILENAQIAEKTLSPLCDDTGIPHLILEVGKGSALYSETLEAIHQGIADGLRKLPGRPMAVRGNDIQRLEQSEGLYSDSEELVAAPILVHLVEDKGLKLHILLQGGGPEIRSKTYRIFHQHKLSVVLDEVVSWIENEVANLGCTPCVPAIGIGRSHFEATSFMLEAMIHGNFTIQNEIERNITSRINESNIGPLGLRGKTTALATFLKVGPQRASGVRIVCMRLCCCMEPRVASVVL